MGHVGRAIAKPCSANRSREGGTETRPIRWAATLALILLVTLPGSALGAPPSPQPQRSADGALTIGHLNALDSLNPFIGFSDTSQLFYSLLYDDLFAVDQDQNFVPNLATSAASPDGGRTWVYQIRQGVKWHDGTEFTAEDVAFTINYNIQNFWLLWAYQPYVNQIVPCEIGQFAGCGGQVTGPSEVSVYFLRPFAPGGSGMLVPILQKRQWETITAQQAQYSFVNPNPIGTGPYRADPNIYTLWVNAQPIVLHRNPAYHFGTPAVERLVLRHFGDENALVIALHQGDIDVALMSASGADVVRQLIQQDTLPRVELQEGLSVTQYWVDLGITQLNHPGVNLRLNPARFDLAVRQAMAHATNKTFILEQFYRGEGVEGSTLVSPVTAFWHYEPQAEKFPYDLATANAILDAAGYTDRDPLTSIRRAAATKTVDVYCSPENLQRGCDTTIDVPQGTPLSFTMVTRVEAPEETETARYLDQTWNQIGIDLTITVEEEVAMNVEVYGGEFDTYIWWWSGDPDPNFLLSIQSNITLNGWSDNYYDNETFNGLYLDQLEALDSAQRRLIVHEAQKVHYLGAAFIILVYPFFHIAWWTDEYEGWGDMVAHPGRQVGAFWGKHPLFLNLVPRSATNRSPTVLSFVASPGEPEARQAIEFTIVAADPDGGTLTFSIDYGAGSTIESRTVDAGPGESASVRFVHAYPTAGLFLARAQVSDGVLLSEIAEAEVGVGAGEPPTTTVVLGGSLGEAGWYLSPVTVTLQASDRGSGVSSTFYRIDGGSWQDYLGPIDVSYEGAHGLEYYSEDNAGHREAIKSTQVRVDVTAPEFTGLSPAGTLTSGRIELAWEAVDATSGISRYEVSVDGGPWQAVGGDGRFAVSLGDGDHSFRVRAFDAAGNARDAEGVFRVDTNVFSLSGPYFGLPTYAIAASAAAAIAVFLWGRGKLRRS